MERFKNHILTLLGERDCVTVPGLGSFLYRDNEAVAYTFTMELRPAGRTVFFNNAIAADDGLLINFICEKEGLSYTAAKEAVQTEIVSLRKTLEEKRNFAFGDLGNFFLNAENEIFFLPAASLNLSKKAYGLPTLKLRDLAMVNTPVAETAGVVTEEAKPLKKAPEPVKEEVYEEAEVLEYSEKESDRGFVWRVAAGFAVISLAGAMYVAASKYGKHKSPAANASITEVQRTPETKTPVIVPEVDQQTQTIMEETDARETETAAVAQAIDKDIWMEQLRAAKGEYYVIGGMFLDEKLALAECKKWNDIGVSVAVYKPKFSSMYRIILARFKKEEDASEFAKEVPEYVGASISVRDMKLF